MLSSVTMSVLRKPIYMHVACLKKTRILVKLTNVTNVDVERQDIRDLLRISKKCSTRDVHADIKAHCKVIII